MNLFYQQWGKRPFDFISSSIIMIVSVPVYLITAFLIYVKLGSPIIFRQQRPGLHGRLFSILKFRTMTDGRDEAENLLPDAQRLTQFGKFLRSSSLDELPELWNVLKGEMSLVGPRPLLEQYLPLYTPEQMRRHEVRPGITGWAQVNGRNALSWEEKFELDVWYVDNHTFWLDIKIILMTIVKIVKRENINQEGQATMKEFIGSTTERGI